MRYGLYAQPMTHDPSPMTGFGTDGNLPVSHPPFDIRHQDLSACSSDAGEMLAAFANPVTTRTSVGTIEKNVKSRR